MHVLVVDDDADFRELLTISLQSQDIRSTSANDGEAALGVLTEAAPGTFDVILLDIDMPLKSGWELLDDLRERGDEIPVLFVTGRESTEDKIRGLKLGADDYIVKPIEFQELLARIEAVLRRRAAMPPLHWGDLTLDLALRKVKRDDHRIDLSPKEFDLLHALARAGGEVQSRDQLLRDVWDLDFDPGTNVLDVHIGRVRKKLDRHGRPLIQTVRGQGYRLVRHDEDAALED